MLWRSITCLASALTLAVSFSAAQASSEDRATYQIALAGISIADMEIAVKRDGDQYNARLEGNYSVLFWSGGVSSRSVGAIAETGPTPNRFETRNKSDEPSQTIIEFERSQGPVNWQRTPPAPTEWTEGRTPLQKAHLRTALDPVSAIAAAALGPVDATADEVCNRDVRVFTGTTVFELQLRGVLEDGADRVNCAIQYRPLSGHRIDSSSVERLSRPGSIRISFDRLPSGAWVPGFVAVPTSVGTLVVERT